MTDNQKLGKKGERAVAKYLKRNRYKIISKNYSCKFGEIDITAENKDFIVFVEVKTRSAGQMLTPMLSVDYKKQMRIMKTAAFFQKYYHTDKQPRFDIAEVVADQKGKLSINYIENAFEWSGGYAPY